MSWDVVDATPSPGLKKQKKERTGWIKLGKICEGLWNTRLPLARELQAVRFWKLGWYSGEFSLGTSCAYALCEVLLWDELFVWTVMAFLLRWPECHEMSEEFIVSSSERPLLVLLVLMLWLLARPPHVSHVQSLQLRRRFPQNNAGWQLPSQIGSRIPSTCVQNRS